MIEESDAATITRDRPGDQEWFRVLVGRHRHALSSD